jgi:hypothetical protein
MVLLFYVEGSRIVMWRRQYLERVLGKPSPEFPQIGLDATDLGRIVIREQ